MKISVQNWLQEGYEVLQFTTKPLAATQENWNDRFDPEDICFGLLTVTCWRQFTSFGFANTVSKVPPNIKGSSVYVGSLELIFVSDYRLSVLHLCHETVLYYNIYRKCWVVVFRCFTEQEPIEAILCLAEVLRFSLKLCYLLCRETSDMSLIQ